MKENPSQKQRAVVIMMANKPDKNTAGSISPDLPKRSATVNTENPKAEPSAAIVPPSVPLEVCPETMIAIAIIATKIANHVAERTRSCKKIQPKIAVIKGAVAKSRSAFATGIT